MWVKAIILWVLSYLLGSVTFGTLVGKWLGGVDVREHGSGNAGATNISRVLGVGPGILVLVLDALKGFLAVWLTQLVVGDPALALVAGIFAIIGHNWPVFFGFRGGKGVATTVGVLAAISFPALLISGVIALLVIALTRYVSLGSLVLVTLMPLLLLAFDKGWAVFAVSLLITLMVYVRHRENIQRLLQGKENRFGQKTSGRKLK